jgi:hypothetical protein
MEQIMKGFDDLVNSNLKVNNKYISAAISLCLILYAFMAAPKLPDYIAQLFDYKLVKVLTMFLLLFVCMKCEPSTSLIVAVGVTILMTVLNLYKHQKEQMAEINKNRQEGIPEFVHSTCGNPRCPNDIADAYRGEHGEIIVDEKNVESDGPISGVSDDEVRSLCIHLKERDKNATKEILTSANFSELSNANEACTFASHQYSIPLAKVPCHDPAKVQNKDVEFSTLAPVN